MFSLEDDSFFPLLALANSNSIHLMMILIEFRRVDLRVTKACFFLKTNTNAKHINFLCMFHQNDSRRRTREGEENEPDA